jgi:hypothetical protein
MTVAAVGSLAITTMAFAQHQRGGAHHAMREDLQSRSRSPGRATKGPLHSREPSTIGQSYSQS